MPRVSICIPSYKPRHFELCLASAIAQTFQDIEIIVSDDCPTDAIKQICDKFPGRVQYSRNPNPGSKNNVVRLIGLAQGEYIKFLLDDDILHPFCVQNLLGALEASKGHNTTLAYSPREFIDEDNNVLRHVNILNITGGIKIIDGAECIRIMTANLNNFIGELTTVMFRRADALGYEPASLLDFPDMTARGLGDVIAWINLATKGNIVAHPATLSYFRQHPGSNSDPAANPEFVYCVTEWRDIVEHMIASGQLPPALHASAYKNLANTYRYWLPHFPQLADDIDQFERHVSEMVA